MAIYSWFSHETWWFSIAMLVYQRVFTNCFSLEFSPIFILGPRWLDTYEHLAKQISAEMCTKAQMELEPTWEMRS